MEPELSLEMLLKVNPGNSYRRGKFSTVDLLIKIGCFGKEKNILSARKADTS
jgi:hypothetical protein